MITSDVIITNIAARYGAQNLSYSHKKKNDSCSVTVPKEKFYLLT